MMMNLKRNESSDLALSCTLQNFSLSCLGWTITMIHRVIQWIVASYHNIIILDVDMDLISSRFITVSSYDSSHMTMSRSQPVWSSLQDKILLVLQWLRLWVVLWPNEFLPSILYSILVQFSVICLFLYLRPMFFCKAMQTTSYICNQDFEL